MCATLLTLMSPAVQLLDDNYIYGQTDKPTLKSHDVKFSTPVHC